MEAVEVTVVLAAEGEVSASNRVRRVPGRFIASEEDRLAKYAKR
jgi:hypothetical protein